MWWGSGDSFQMIRPSRPEEVNILGKSYAISYLDKPSDVDLYQRKSLWGEIDYWTRSIRIYDNGRADEDIWHTIIHEVIHGITAGLNLTELDKSTNHEEIDVLALALVDVLSRNGWW